jgi:hypothetical protein
MTFFRPEHRRDKIHKFGHTHLDDLVERADKFQNELIILGHFSTRYSDRQVKSAIDKRLPERLKPRVKLWCSEGLDRKPEPPRSEETPAKPAKPRKPREK